jgi:VIT1/CCC1 family predicted Fe2+/Mn2+ transporter
MDSNFPQAPFVRQQEMTKVAASSLKDPAAIFPTLLGLSPDVSLCEILFGLIMVLTFTLGAGVAASEDPSEARALILGAITCNIAWGLIDAVFHVMSTRFVRSRRERLLEKFQSFDRSAAIEMLRRELNEQLEAITSEADRAQLYDRIYDALKKRTAIVAPSDPNDIRGAFGVFLLVSLSALPAAIPFLFVTDAWQALRISNAILLGLIFLVGYRWAGLTLANPWKTGAGLMLLGAALVVVAIALGG